MVQHALVGFGLIVVMTVTACSPALETIALPPAALVPAGVMGCSETFAPATLHGSRDDARLVWLELFDGERVELIWPPGYGARFAPSLEVVDATGSPVIGEGDFVDGSCEIGDRQGRLMEPPFLALRLDCGPLVIEDCGGARLRLVIKAHGWPQREIESVRFLAANGDYRIRFEDGSEIEGNGIFP